ncbi:electron transfer flavoprotein subunit alpha/FixB family protein [Acidilobus saccharovorans]|nr:electron transfer flavoprotein subunit alpha/FixB family protein [Acidilobus saccharovorans]
MASSLVVGGSEDDIAEALTIARQLGSVHIVAYGNVNAASLAEYGHIVYHIAQDDPESIFKAVKEIYDQVKPSLVVALTSKNLKDALSRLAGLYDLPMATEVFNVKLSGDQVSYTRGFLSGRALEDDVVPLPAVLLLAARKTPKAQKSQSKGDVKELTVTPSIKVVERRPKERGGVNIEAAEIIVSVGRGFRSKDDLKLAFDLAEVLNAQIGCSRPVAADLKWLSEDHWVGLSGHKVAPKLYMAIGISGAPQHLAGITDAKLVVAINNDKSAPIFKNCDYGVVADLYQFVPVLTKRLRERLHK